MFPSHNTQTEIKPRSKATQQSLTITGSAAPFLPARLAERLDSSWSDCSAWANRDELAKQLRDKSQYYGLVSETDLHLGRLS